ncbi:hypothetical protein HAX54_016416, partial [Datura stramonium]|nr:hypothetical protein [Datura stramonium]
ICKCHVESRWWGHRPLDFINFHVSADDGVGEYESIASVISGPNFLLLGDESQSICAGSPNSSQGQSNLGHANVAPDVGVLSDKGVDENTKMKGKEQMTKHCSASEIVRQTLMSLLAMKVIRR